MEKILGEDILSACRRAVSEAAATGKAVTFDFNGVSVTAQPGAGAEALERAWWDGAGLAYRPTPAAPPVKPRRAD